MNRGILSLALEMLVTGSIIPNKFGPTLIGVSGGSGSGKTHFAHELASALGEKRCEIVLQDHFYRDQSAQFDFDGGSVNFDHPDAFDFVTLGEFLRHLRAGQRSEMPLYDFKTHSRLKDEHWVSPKPVIIVDGILIFHDKSLLDLFDYRIFFDTDEDLRFQRRLERDVRERGRTPEGIRSQFFNQVKPMHDLYVKPCAHHAHVVIGNDPQEYQILLENCIRELRF